jgi:hypothetical protein
MLYRIEQVLLTYVRQWQFWLYVAGWVVMFPLLDVLPSYWQRLMAFIFLSLAGTGPAAVIGHAKQQIADARATLMPGFRAPHVVVATALSLAALVVMPLLTHGVLGVPLLGLIASVAVVSVAFSVLAYFQSVASVAIALGATAFLLLDPVREAGYAMLLGQSNGLALIVLTVSLFALGWIVWRLATLREGMPEYNRVLGGRSDYAWRDGRTEAPSADVARPSPITRLQLAAADRRLRAVRNVFAARAWPRVQHWMLSGEMSGAKWMGGVALAALLTAIPAITGQAKGDYGIVALAALMSVLMPVFCVTATWMTRRRSMGYELTRPASRQAYVREFGLAVAADLAEWWMWLTLAALVPVLVWGPPLRVADVLAMLVLSAAEQVLAFGVLVSVLRVRSPNASDGSIMLSVVMVVVPIMTTATIPRTPITTLMIAVGVAALGAALAYDAYRRWCETDLA